MTELPYQIVGSEWLAERERAMLADDMGCGKTLQAIRAADLVFAINMLVICPASLVGNWHAEVARWRIGAWSVFVTSYEGASGANRDFIFSRRWSVLVVDVVSIVREFEGLVDLADHVWLLTGTPIPNNPSELYPHFKALAPERIRSTRSGKVWSVEQFTAYFCKLQPAFSGMKIVGSRNEEELAKRLDGFMLRRLKKDVLPELPDVRFSEFDISADMNDIDLGIDPKEAAELKRILDEHGVAGLKGHYSHFASLRRVTGLAKVKPVAEYLRMFMETTDRKIVVFAQHTDVIGALLRQRGMSQFVALTGATMPKARENAVHRFQTDPFIRGFIGQIQAAGTGITLTAAHDLLFVETSWVPAENAQAAMRIHRIGQKSLCDVRYAVLPKSIDAIIARAVMRKSESIAKVLGETT